MSSKAITEQREGPRQGQRWHAPAELSPSVTQDTEPFWARLAGAFGLALLVFGGVALIVQMTGRTSWVGATWGSLCVFFGLGLLLFHAASDADLQVRRAYMIFGYLWLAAGVLISIIPYRGPVGAHFLPYGLVALGMGLLFLLAFVRNEVEDRVRDMALYVLGGVGAATALVGFGYSNIEGSFLLPNGLLLILLGFFFLWAFAGLRGMSDDLGYKAALAIGALGALAVLVALARSMPHWLAQTNVFAGRGWLAGAAPYLMPNGIVLVISGLLYVGLSLGLTSDQPYVVMTRRQLGAYFNSPVAYFMLVMFSVVACFSFGNYVLDWLWDGFTNKPATAVPEPIIRPLFFNLVPVFCLVFVVPVLTMNLLSEEHRTGTLEMTLTTPQEETTIVLAKFTAALFLFLLTWVPWAMYLVALRVGGGQPFDYQPFLAWLIVLVFTGAGFVSMGLFFSSLTKNQLTAAVFTFVGMLILVGVFLLMETPQNQGSFWYKVSNQVSFLFLWRDSLRGQLAVYQLFYHLSVTAFWLFLTVKVLESRKWR